MTVDEMNERMSNGEFVEWKVYHARRAQREELEAMRARHKKGG
jgi:hypothetical protein